MSHVSKNTLTLTIMWPWIIMERNGSLCEGCGWDLYDIMWLNILKGTSCPWQSLPQTLLCSYPPDKQSVGEVIKQCFWLTKTSTQQEMVICDICSWSQHGMYMWALRRLPHTIFAADRSRSYEKPNSNVWWDHVAMIGTANFQPIYNLFFYPKSI